MQRIINGVLYDTVKSDFICAFNGNITSKKQRSPNCWNYYIAKNGIIFQTHYNDIKLSSEYDPTSSEFMVQEKEIKRRMKPSLYKKYFGLIIPGEENKPKKSEKPFKRLDTIK